MTFGTKDISYKSKNKKKIIKFFETNNIKYLDEVLPLKKKHDFKLPNIYIKSFSRLNKIFNNNIYFIEDYYNFSGSFKDRASLISCLDAKEKNFKEVSVASSGNAAISTAIFCNMFGLRCSVFIPSFASKEKKQYLKNLGCKIFEFKMPYSKVVKKCLSHSKKYKTYNRCTGLNPVTRDGKKIFSYELIAKFKKKIDYFILPVGDGNILSGCIKGFLELSKMNFMKKIPTIVGVQSKSSSSFYNQYIKNSEKPILSKANSVCDSINVDYPLDGFFAYKYLNKVKGKMMVETDKNIIKSKKILLKKFGINCCSSSASTFAILKKLILNKKINNKNILLLLTGTGFKDLSNN
jgi:threonine synthase